MYLLSLNRPINRPMFGIRQSLEPYKGVITQNFIDILEFDGKLGPVQSEVVADHLLKDIGIGSLAGKYKIAKSNIKQKLDNAAIAFRKAIETSKNKP